MYTNPMVFLHSTPYTSRHPLTKQCLLAPLPEGNRIKKLQNEPSDRLVVEYHYIRPIRQPGLPCPSWRIRLYMSNRHFYICSHHFTSGFDSFGEP
jgi:hypothetical protein